GCVARPSRQRPAQEHGRVPGPFRGRQEPSEGATRAAVVVASRYRRRPAAVPYSGCPSVDPDFRQGLVALSQKRPQLDRLSFHLALEAQPPPTGVRIGLRNDVLHLGLLRCHHAFDAGRIDALEVVAKQIEDEQARVLASCPYPASCISRANVPLGYPVSSAADRCSCVRPWPAARFSAARTRQCCRGLPPWSGSNSMTPPSLFARAGAMARQESSVRGAVLRSRLLLQEQSGHR